MTTKAEYLLVHHIRETLRAAWASSHEMIQQIEGQAYKSIEELDETDTQVFDLGFGANQHIKFQHEPRIIEPL